MKNRISLAGSFLSIRYVGWEFIIDLGDYLYPIGLDYFCICDQTLAIKYGWA